MPSCLDMECRCLGANAPPLEKQAHAKLRYPDFPCACCRLYDLWAHARSENRRKVFQIPKGLLATYLKEAGHTLGLANANRLGSHAFRRGATQDMVNAGSPIALILRLGGWKSDSVLHYMVMDDLENRNYALKASEDSDSD